MLDADDCLRLCIGVCYFHVYAGDHRHIYCPLRPVAQLAAVSGHSNSIHIAAAVLHAPSHAAGHGAPQGQGCPSANHGATVTCGSGFGLSGCGARDV